MRPGRILHPELARALATLGHTDIVLVTDAGFPIPASANRIDLGFAPRRPSVPEILEVLSAEIHVEDVSFAPEVRSHNPRLYQDLQRIYTGSGATFTATTHEELCADVAGRAKVVIRSGDFDPWANIALTASTDPFAWFTDAAVDEGLVVLPAYLERRRRITDRDVPALPGL